MGWPRADRRASIRYSYAFGRCTPPSLASHRLSSRPYIQASQPTDQTLHHFGYVQVFLYLRLLLWRQPVVVA